MKKFRSVSVLALLFLMLGFQSCYSVRIRGVNGVPMPDPVGDRSDYYRGMEVIEMDTTISIDLITKDFTLLVRESEKCPTARIHTLEYRNTFGGLLLSGITFGRKRQVHIKYVCLKPEN
jgi:hypothetical protein